MGDTLLSPYPWSVASHSSNATNRSRSSADKPIIDLRRCAYAIEVTVHEASTGGDNGATALTGAARYKVECGFHATCLYHFRAPFTGGERVWVPAGIVLDTGSEEATDAIALHVTPTPESAWQDVFAPGLRDSGRYAGYSLVIDKEEMERYCRPVGPVEAATTPEDLAQVEAFSGCLLGTAVGDALGFRSKV